MAVSKAVFEIYSPKQVEVLRLYYRNRKPSMIINHGAVRSGKTIIDNDLFIAEIKRISEYCAMHNIKEAQYILAGASIGNIEKNILSELRKKYNISTKLDRFNRFKLFGVSICCVGHDDIGNISAITGMTAYGVYINEGHLAKKEVFDELMKRCSADIGFHAIKIVDANPDAPSHYLKVDYIDKAEGERIVAVQWSLYDNPFLNKEYVEDLEKTTPSGVFYDRKILGRWVSAEGVVYLDFDAKRHYINARPAPKDVCHYFAGVDWGYSHKGSIGVFCELKDGAVVLIEEITAQFKLIEWWQNEAKKMQSKYGKGIPFYCDSARPEHLQSFRNQGIWAINSEKNVNAGIEQVSKRFKAGTFFIYKEGIMEFDKEIYNYCWDSKTGAPVKVNDDVMDMIRYAIYTHDRKRGLC